MYLLFSAFMILNNESFPILINSLAPSYWEKCCSSCSMKQTIWAGRKWFGWSFSWTEGLTGDVRGNGRILTLPTDNIPKEVQSKTGNEKLCKNLISYIWNDGGQHWNMLTCSSGRSVCYTPTQSGPQRSARHRTQPCLFFRYSLCKDHWQTWGGYLGSFWRLNSYLSYLPL